MKNAMSMKGYGVFFPVFFLLFTAPLLSRAATFNVTRTDDPAPGACTANDCSLREAVSAANISLDTDNVINLQSGQTYSLTQSGLDNTNAAGDLDFFRILPGNYTINGNGARVQQDAESERVFDVRSNLIGVTNLTVNDLEITGGGNHPQFDLPGGGILFSGTLGFENLTLNNVWIHDNFAVASNGGAVSVNSANTQINASTFSANDAGNNGGGLELFNAIADINNSTISDNTAITFDGGGIFCTNCVVGARNVTITDNHAPAGSAGGFGGTDIVLTLKNSILFDNTANNQPTFQNCFGTFFIFNSDGFNILQDNGGGCSPGTDDLSDDPLLASLDDNGGLGPTHLLTVPNSPAINGGDPAGCTDGDDVPFPTDQRGVPRPQGAACDIGSVEMVICGDGTTGPGEECDGSECCVQCQFATLGTSCSVGSCNTQGQCIPIGGGGGSGGDGDGDGTGGGGTNGGTNGGTGGNGGAGEEGNGGCSIGAPSTGNDFTAWGTLFALAGALWFVSRRYSN